MLAREKAALLWQDEKNLRLSQHCAVSAQSFGADTLRLIRPT